MRNAPILILDEATASLDAQSEAEVQTAIDQRGTFWGDITEKNTDLAVLNPSGRSAVLTLHASGLIPFCEKTGFSHDSDPFGVGQVFQDILL